MIARLTILRAAAPGLRRLVRALAGSSAAAALLASAAVVASPGGALAYPDAKIDTQIKPEFGLLLKPKLRQHHRPHKPRWRGRYGYRSGVYDPNDLGPYDDPPPFQGQTITVDCGNPAPLPPPVDSYGGSDGGGGNDSYGPADPGGDSYGDGAYPVSNGPISDAVRQVAPGGTVYVRASAACTETIVIDRPVIIAGEPTSAFADGPARRPQLTPAAAAPCIRVLPGSGNVEIRDFEIEAVRGAAASCVEAWDSSVALVRTRIRYTGDGSAIYAAGGRLIVRQSSIEAKTYDAAVVADGADFEISGTRIRGEGAGLDLTAGATGGTLERVKVHSDASAPGGEGVLIRGLRSGSGRIKIRNVLTRGWRVGFHLERGAAADIERSRVVGARYGVISDFGDLNLTESAIGADQIGVYVAGGRARIYRNRIFGVRTRGILAEPGSDIQRGDNWINQVGDWRSCAREDGEYCYDFSRSWGLLSDEGRDDAYGWQGDGYDAGYLRDGAPAPYTPPPVKRRRGWQRR